MSTPVELDEYAQGALRDLATTGRIIAEQESMRAKARSILTDFLLTHDADVGVVDGQPRVKLTTYDVSGIDVTRLRADEPFLARRYLRVRTDRRLTLLDLS